MNLRARTIRLAYGNPALREKLLPLLSGAGKTAGSPVERLVALAASEAAKSKSRTTYLDENLDALKKLLPRVENADRVAGTKFRRLLDHLVKMTGTSTKSAKRLAEGVEKFLPTNGKGDALEQLNAWVALLERRVNGFASFQIREESTILSESGLAADRLRAAEQLHSYARGYFEDSIADLPALVEAYRAEISP